MKEVYREHQTFEEQKKRDEQYFIGYEKLMQDEEKTMASLKQSGE